MVFLIGCEPELIYRELKAKFEARRAYSEALNFGALPCEASCMAREVYERLTSLA